MEEFELSTKTNFEIEEEFLGIIDEESFVKKNQAETEENEDAALISGMQAKINAYIEGKKNVEMLKRTAHYSCYFFAVRNCWCFQYGTN